MFEAPFEAVVGLLKIPCPIPVDFVVAPYLFLF